MINNEKITSSTPFKQVVFVLLMIAVGIALGCDKDEDEPQPPANQNPTDTTTTDTSGTDTTVAEPPLELIQSFQVSNSSANFSAGDVVGFTAAFNKETDWRIEILGEESGSLKVFEGNDSIVNATWEGGTDNLPLFGVEMCNVTFIVPDSTELNAAANVEIIDTKEYEGVLVTDFEENPAANVSLGDFEFELTAESGWKNDLIAAQGEYFYRLEGTDNEGGGPTDNFFVGLVDIFPSINGETYFEIPTVLADQLYLNFFIRGRGNPYTRVQIELIFDTDGNGEFDDGIDESVFHFVTPDYEGWRLYAVAANEMGVTTEPLDEIVALRVILVSLNDLQPSPREEVGVEIDYITFTEGGPLEL